ncbi:DnaD domain-containing protein [Lactiplantibacillus plajomi]|uniref:DnaD domain-containing protein n=1 Tax=Lactiplantibacillus plajomi TaxID=1457217 RepID=A0ABV6K226_9LACO|nr:DnaD domain protein [Lactiplantibacillus plajomi]
MELLAHALLHDGQTAVANTLLVHYREIGLTNDELLVYLQFKRLTDQGQQFPDAAVVAKSLGESSNTVFQRLHEMLAKKFLTIESVTGADNKIHDRYNFDGLYDKLALAVKQPERAAATQTDQAVATNPRQKVFTDIQREFGRALSPIEMESISKWFDEDQYDPEVIGLALREAVLRQVYNLTYMDRILLNWQKRGLRTAQQVEAERQRSLEQRLNGGSQPKRQTGENALPKIPLFKIGEESNQAKK